ncbi:hypothetical protein BDZ89DRAFT_1151860 [Hymenopellis radicata]|nr:hypothetical protein BDZ89DRAFT_1151860 [Hymenopellis radicata]
MWMWKTLEQDSEVYQWYTLLADADREEMRGDYREFIEVVKQDWLGAEWIMEMQRVMELQSFRQKGYESESPAGFIGRRTVFIRLLSKVDVDSREEMELIMLKAPTAWKPILHLETIESTRSLLARVVEHRCTLVFAANRERGPAISASSLAPILQSLGVSMNPRFRYPRPERRPGQTTGKESFNVEGLDENSDDFGDGTAETTTSHDDANEVFDVEVGANDDFVYKSAFQVVKKAFNEGVKRTYPFEKDDSVMTKLGQLPPSPCRACGSKNHWNRECPHWQLYLARQNTKWKNAKSAKLSETSPYSRDPERVERAYNMAYQVLFSQKMVDLDRLAEETQQDFEEAALNSDEVRGRKTYVYGSWRIQEVIDKDVKDAVSRPPRNPNHVLEKIKKFWTPDDYERERNRRNFEEESYAPPKSHLPAKEGVPPDKEDVTDIEVPANANMTDSDDSNTTEFENSRREGLNIETHQEESTSSVPLNPSTGSESNIDPPAPDVPYLLRPRRKRASGCSALGVSVLSMKGPVGSLDGPVIDQRLDSCANISLMSMECYESLSKKPAMKKGKKMMLWQVTDKSKAIQGYCDLPIFTETVEGSIIETTAEVFLVPGMSVPLLLGEDYHINYELSVIRDIENGTTVRFGKTKFAVRARAVDGSADWKNLRTSAYGLAHFLKAKLHRRQQTRKRRVKQTETMRNATVRAAQDYRIKPHTCVNVLVEGNLGDDEEWIVERGLLPLKGSMYLATPNVLLTPEFRKDDTKGELIGSIQRAGDYFDKAKSVEEYEKYEAMNQKIAALVNANLEAADTTESKDGTADEQKEDEDIGPKTAAMPDPTIYPSRNLRKLIDIGTIPEDLEEEAWKILEKHEGAFGFDGRLGNVKTTAKIRLKEGTELETSTSHRVTESSGDSTRLGHLGVRTRVTHESHTRESGYESEYRSVGRESSHNESQIFRDIF